MNSSELENARQRISEARHHDPFCVLGRHGDGERCVVRAYLPGASEVRIAEGGHLLERVGDSDHFE